MRPALDASCSTAARSPARRRIASRTSGSLYGPIIGSFVFIWLSESVSTLWARWPLLLGLAFVVVVMFFRGGVVEAWHRLALKVNAFRN